MQPQWKFWCIGLAISACETTASPGITAADAVPGDSFAVGQLTDADATGAGNSQGDAALSAGQPIKVDFLWMIDHSSSMAQEQRQLAKAFAGFAKELASTTGGNAVDAQMAVVSVQQIADAMEIKQIGKFVHKAATVLPPSAIERVKMPCFADVECTAPKCFKMYNAEGKTSMCPVEGKDCFTPTALPAGDWFCKTDTASPQFNNNDNCSVNSHCQLRCQNDEDCYAQYEPDIPAGGKTRL